MKIVSLNAENVKRLTAVHIEPNGDVVVIGGKNGAGKSSVLDSIMYALGGKSAIPAKPIRNGEDSARVQVDLGDLIVTRTWTDKGSYLKVTTTDGASYSSGQKMLDELIGRLTFDPLEFVGMGPREQAAMLRELVGIDHADLDARRQQVYEQRTEANREIKRLAGAVSTKAYHKDAPREEVSVAGLMEELREAQAQNRQRDDVFAKVRDAEHSLVLAGQAVDRANQWIADLKRQLAEAVEDAERACKERDEIKEAVDRRRAVAEKMPEVDCDPIHERIAGAEAVNAKVRANAERASLLHEKNLAESRADALTAEIQQIDERKAADLAAAKFPLDGLGFDDNGVTLNGVPFGQASQAEALRAATAIGLAMNPKLRVVLLREASNLDEDAMRLMVELAAEYDAQLWLERVGDGDDGAVIIEDGAVRGAEVVGV